MRGPQKENAELRVERARLRAKVLDLAKDNEAITAALTKIDPASLTSFGLQNSQSMLMRSPVAEPSGTKLQSDREKSIPLTPEVRKELVAELKNDILSIIKDATTPIKSAPSHPLLERLRRDSGYNLDTNSFESCSSQIPTFRSSESRRTVLHKTLDSVGTADSPQVSAMSANSASSDAYTFASLGDSKKMAHLDDSIGDAPRQPDSIVTVMRSPDGKFIINDGLGSPGVDGRRTSGRTGLEQLACTVILKNLIVPGQTSSPGAQGVMRTITDFVGRWGTLAQPLKLVKDKEDGTSLAVIEMQTPEQAANVVSGMDGAIYNGNVINAFCSLPSGIEWKDFQSFGGSKV